MLSSFTRQLSFACFAAITAVTTAQALAGQCPVMTTSNVFLTFTGNQGCTVGNTCKNGENLTFSLGQSTYNFNCANHTYNWNFGDGTSSTSATPTKSFNTTGAHTVTVTISSQYQSNFQRQWTINTAGTGGGGGGGGGGGSGPCATIRPDVNLAITYGNASSTCRPSTSSCVAGDPITFNVVPVVTYDFDCAHHSFDWMFGDGSSFAKTKEVVHVFAAGGAFNVTCVVSNGAQTAVLTKSIAVSDGSTSIDITAVITTVRVQDIPHAFQFSVTVNSPSGISQYAWDFGDGGSITKGTPTPVVWIYSKSGTYRVTLRMYDFLGYLLKAEIANVSDATSRRRAVRR